MTSLHVIYGLGLPQSKIQATLMVSKYAAYKKKIIILRYSKTINILRDAAKSIIYQRFGRRNILYVLF